MFHRLDQAIPPEIYQDDLYFALQELASRPEVKTILEIGSSDGRGSTKAFIERMQNNPECKLFCIESSIGRFELLNNRYRDDSVRCFNVCTIPLPMYMADDDIAEFYHNYQTNLNRYSLEQILGWKKEEMDYIQSNHIPDNGIEVIMHETGITQFDLVLIDGSAFTAEAELSRLYGARYIALDDVNDIKNWRNYEFLMHNPDYELEKENRALRNGYAIFKKVKEGK